MKILSFVIIIFTINTITFSQNNDIQINFITNKMIVKNNDKIIFEKEYLNPSSFYVDFDNDGNEEYLINDFVIKDSHKFYTIYIYNIIDNPDASQTDTFSLIDSIYSGLKEPLFLLSDEIDEMILVVGYPELDSLNYKLNDSIFSPLNCFYYDGINFQNINDKLYDIFINDNDIMLDYLDSQSSIIPTNAGRDCSFTLNNKNVIVSIFINYLNADEKSLANEFITQYYLCDDLNEFKNYLEEIYKK